MELEWKCQQTPCPFCGSSAIVKKCSTEFYMRCLGCLVETRLFPTAGEAMDFWEKRNDSSAIYDAEADDAGTLLPDMPEASRRDPYARKF